MKYLLIAILLFTTNLAYSRGGSFGGSRGYSSSSSRSASRPSSFGGSRATTNAPIVRPTSPTSTTGTVARPVYAQSAQTTVVHTSGSSGLMTGMIVGSMLAHNNQGGGTTIVNNGQPGAAGVASVNDNSAQPQTVYIQPPQETHWLWNLFCTVCVCGIVLCGLYFLLVPVL